jgi:hypothetical protein
VRHLQAAGAESQGQFDEVGQAVQVLPVDHGVERQRQAGGAHDRGEGQLAGMAAGVAADAVGAARFRVLDGELHVVEAGFDQLVEAPLVRQHAGGDEVGVEPGRDGVADDGGEVAARGGLAARQVDLQHAERRGFGEDAAPGGGIQLARGTVQLGGVRAVRATQRAAMGELGKETERRLGAHFVTGHAGALKRRERLAAAGRVETEPRGAR